MALGASLARIGRRILRRPEPVPPPPFNHARNPYRCRRPWPPNVLKLSENHQFRLEKRYKKRIAMKYLTPAWMKWTNIARWGTITFVVVYWVLFYDSTKDPWNPSGEEIMQPVRDYVFGAWNALWTPLPERHTLYEDNIKQSKPNGANDTKEPRARR